jgi:hypothetical protein
VVFFSLPSLIGLLSDRRRGILVWLSEGPSFARPTMTATPPPPGPVLPPDEKFWQRHSPHHEFPFSTVVTVLVHLAVLFLIVIVANVHGCTAERTKPLEIVVLDVPGGDDVPNADPGSRGGDRVGPEFQPKDLPAHTPMGPLPRPTPTPLDQPTDQPSVERPREADAAGNLGRDIDRALGRLKGGGAPGQGPQTGDGGGPAGTAGNERSRRMARWTLHLSYSTYEDYVRQLQLLGAQVGLPRPGDTERVDLIRDLGRRPAQLEPTAIAQINRIFWRNADEASARGVCQVLGVPAPEPPMFFAFLPVALEEELAAKERAVMQRLGRKRVEDVEETIFAVSFLGNRPVLEVVEQTGTDGRRAVLKPRPR